jgi:hypothetical protein
MSFHKNTQISIVALWFVCVFVNVIILPGHLTAQDITLIPSIRVQGEYDDNVTFSRTEEVDDYVATISPALTFDYATRLLDVRSVLRLDILRYAEESRLDTENQRYELEGAYQVLERLRLTAGALYIKDTTLDSELEETGLITRREDRERWNGNAGLSYAVSEVSDMGVNYSYTDTEYDSRGKVDYDVNSVVFSYDHRLKTQTDVVTVQPYYMDYDSQLSEVDNYGVSLGWFHAFTEKWTLTAFLGFRYTETEGQGFSEENWGGVADIYVKNRGELFEWTAGYNRALEYSSEGEPIDRDRLYFRGNRRITRRFGVGLDGSLYFTESEGDRDNEDSRYFYLTPRLTYWITEDYFLQGAYRYSNSRDKTLDSNKVAERNRVWVSVNFKFPRKW